MAKDKTTKETLSNQIEKKGLKLARGGAVKAGVPTKKKGK